MWEKFWNIQGGIVFWCHVVGGKPGEEEYTSKFPMMSIESIVGGQGSCSTSTNSGRSSFKGKYLIK